VAETTVQRQLQQSETLSRNSISPEITRRRRSETPPDNITSSDEARYVEQEERAIKRIEDNDLNYENE
jgi:hypothetical protein